MTLPTSFVRMAPEPDAGGGGSAEADALARGDILPEAVPEKEHPDAEKVAKELDAELEAEAEAEKDPETEKEHKKDSRIPESRHKAILEKEREKRADLERQLAQYQNGQQVADVNQQITAAEDSIMKMEKQYAELLTDGEIDKATALMADIRRAERGMAEAKSDMKIHAAESRATERARYNTTLERIEGAFPELNPDHNDYSEELMAEVAELKDAYQMKGLTPTAALQKAVKALVEPRTSKQEMATNTNPRVSEKDVAAERKTEAVKKTAEATGRQPPSLSKVGIDSDRLGGGKRDIHAVMTMSQKEFAALSQDDLAAMRGDTI